MDSTVNIALLIIYRYKLEHIFKGYVYCILFQQTLKGKVDQACRTADEFTKLYYESVDKRRHVSYSSIFI